MLKIIAVSTALALAAGAAVAAPAGYGSAVVRVGDLDLGRPADVERLQRRLETAALEVSPDQMDAIIDALNDVLGGDDDFDDDDD